MSENRDQKWHLRPRPLPIGHAPPNRPRLPLGEVKRRSHPLKFNWRSGATGDDVIRKHRVESVRSRWQPSWNGGHVGMASILEWGPCCNGGHVGTASILEWQPSWNGGHVGMASMLEWQPSWISSFLGGVHLGRVAILDWQPSW